VKLSIITPVLNRANFVESAIQSVANQFHENWEHLIIDGGSTDGSINIYARYPHLSVHVAPDRNVYDAFNKGIKLASGEVIGILNSDDLYLDGILDEVVRIFDHNPDIDVVSGGCMFVERENGVEKPIFRYLHTGILELIPFALVRYPVMVNARFFRKRVFDRIGMFDIRYPIVADRQFLLRLATSGLRNQTLKKVLCKYVLHGDALSHKPDGVGNLVLEENLNCARDMVGEAQQKLVKRVFEFWEVWSVLILAIDRVKKGKPPAGLSLCFKNTWLIVKQTPILWIELLRHFRERKLKEV